MKNKKIYIPTQNPVPLAKVHYVCSGGCGLVSNERIKCNTPGCYRNRNPLTECRCRDGLHQEVITLNVGEGLPLPENTTLKEISKEELKNLRRKISKEKK
jgi:hypothetical protein